MKKTIFFIIGLLLFIPTLFADMGSPTIEPYKATINNKNGAVVYTVKYENGKYVYKKTNKTLKYGKTVTITFDSEDYISIGYEGDYVKASDVTIINKNYKIIDKDWASKKTQIVLRDQVIKKGPANGYDSTNTTIPALTKVEARAYKSDDASTWYYVEYNGTKGFIDSYDKGMTIASETGDLRAYTDIPITDIATGETSTIKTNTVIKGTYYYLDMWSRSLYLDTDNYKGIVPNEGFAFKEEEAMEGTANWDLNVYESINLDKPEKSKVIGKVKQGETIINTYSTSYYDSDIVYYENGNIKGWILDNPKKVPYPDDPRATMNEYGIKWPEDELEEDDELEDEIEEEVPEVIAPNEETIPTDPGTNPESMPDGIVKTVLNNPLYSCLIIGVALVVVAIVIIKYVNKKKEKND